MRTPYKIDQNVNLEVQSEQMIRIDGYQAKVNQIFSTFKSEKTGPYDECWHLFDLGDITVGTVKKYKWI